MPRNEDCRIQDRSTLGDSQAPVCLCLLGAPPGVGRGFPSRQAGLSTKREDTSGLDQSKRALGVSSVASVASTSQMVHGEVGTEERMGAGSLQTDGATGAEN